MRMHALAIAPIALAASAALAGPYDQPYSIIDTEDFGTTDMRMAPVVVSKVDGVPTVDGRAVGSLADKFDIDFGWEGDHIHFERQGVHGTITVREKEIRIQARLGFMLLFLKPQIEHEITRYLRAHFGCTID